MDALKDWLISPDELKITNALGQGQFGKVFLGFLKMKSGSDKKVAVKTIKGNRQGELALSYRCFWLKSRHFSLLCQYFLV